MRQPVAAGLTNTQGNEAGFCPLLNISDSKDQEVSSAVGPLQGNATR